MYLKSVVRSLPVRDVRTHCTVVRWAVESGSHSNRCSGVGRELG